MLRPIASGVVLKVLSHNVDTTLEMTGRHLPMEISACGLLLGCLLTILSSTVKK